MRGQLQASRERIKRIVNTSPTEVLISRKATVLNSRGEKVEDPFSTSTGTIARFRLAHDIKQAPTAEVVNSNTFTTNYNRVATWEWNTDIREGDRFTDPDIGREFEFGRVDTLRKHGGVVGFQSTIREAASLGTAAPVIPALSAAQRATLDIILARLRKPLQSLPDVEKRQVNDVVDSIDRRMIAGEQLTSAFETEILAYLDSVMVYAQALTQIQQDKAKIQIEKIKAML